MHPRAAQREIGGEREVRERVAASLSKIVSLRGRTLPRVVALLDWDHRLPSKQLTLRLHALYDEKGAARLEEAWAARTVEIKKKDLFPEFDVPDLADLPGDVSYDAELTAEMTI